MPNVGIVAVCKAKRPPELRVLVVSGVCEACEPAPVIKAVLVKEAALVTQVAHPMAPAAEVVTGAVPLKPDVPTAEMAILLLVTAIPLSVRVHVVLLTTQVIRSVVVGTVAKPRIVLLAVAALPQVVVKFPLAGNMDSVPAVPEIPRVGVNVRAGVAPAIILPADPARSSVVAVAVPPTFSVELGEVIVSPPPPLEAILRPVAERVKVTFDPAVKPCSWTSATQLVELLGST